MKKRFYIQGMHCASCEVLIEKTLIEKKGVRRVEASLVGGTLDIAYDAQIIKIDCGFLNQMFKDLGYTFSDKRLEKNSGGRKHPRFSMEVFFSRYLYCLPSLIVCVSDSL